MEVLGENALQMIKRSRACGSSINDVMNVSLFNKPRLPIFKELAKRGAKEGKEKKRRAKIRAVATGKETEVVEEH